MKRFYKQVSVGVAVEGATVLLDGRPVRTPERRPLAVPPAALAQRLAEEWEAQAEEIRPPEMPFTRLAATALDRVTPQRDAVVDQIAGYAATDLICYRAEASADVLARQRAVWNPLLDWCWGNCGARLAVASGVMPLEQSPEALAAIRAAVAGYGDLQLSALHALTSSFGSVVIGLAVTAGHIGGEAGFAAAQLDESYQAEQWGEDDLARRRRDDLRRDMLAAVEFLALLGQ